MLLYVTAIKSIITMAMYTSGREEQYCLLTEDYEVFCLVLQVVTSGGSRILQNVGSHLQDYMVPQSPYCHQYLKFDGFL